MPQSSSATQQPNAPTPQSEELLRLIAENIEDYAIFAIDLDGRAASWNRGVEKLLGYTEADFVGRDACEIFTPEDQEHDACGHEMRTAKEHGRAEDQRWHLRKDGSRFWANGLMMSLRDEAGNLRGYTKIMRDDTKRKEAEDELRSSRLRFGTALAIADLGTFEWNLLTDAVTLDDRSREIFGFAPDEGTLAQHVFARIDASDIDRVQSEVRVALRDASRAEIEYRINLPDGTSRIIASINDAVLGGDGKVERVVGVFKDITARKRKENSLRFLAEISRDSARLTNIDEVMRIVGAKIGAHLGLSLCNFVEIDEAANEVVINHAWNRADVPVTLGTYRLSDYVTDEFQRAGRAGEMVVVNDKRTDPRTNADQYAALRIGSFLCVPLVRDGEWRFLLSVYHSEPHDWRADEIELMRELTSRIWTRLERARAEETLRESEEKYRTLFDSIDEGFCVMQIIFDEEDHPLDWHYVETNPAFERQTGLVDAAGKNVRELLPNLEQRWFDIYGRVALTGESIRFENYVAEIDRWFDLYTFRVGKPEERKVAVIFTHITERKRAAEERERLLRSLEVERTRLTTIFAKAPAFVATLRGPDHVFELTNPAYRQLVGHRDLIGKTVRQAFPDIEGQGFYERLDRVYQTGEVYEGSEIRISLQREPGGAPEERFINLIYQPMFDEDGAISGIFAHGVDITDQVRARKVAEDANRIKDEFLATLSHELRTPLTSILGWSSMLTSGQLQSDASARALGTITRNARAQVQMIDDLLDIGRIITGKLRLDVREVDLPSVVTGAIDTLRPAAEAKNIKLQILLDPHAGPVTGDSDRLQQVVWNLVSNAIKFTPKDGRVQVRLERTGSHIEIVVSDSGRGIAAEFLPHVFDRFRQADQTTTRAIGGLGLGLAIVRQLVELHGGTVAVSSPGADQGTTFTISLPLAPVRTNGVNSNSGERAQPTPHADQALDCPPELANLRVLVVDDEPDTREMLAFVLTNCGARVMTAASAAEGLETLRREQPDVLVSDIGMPDEDGYSLLARVRRLSREEGGGTPAIALTAYARAEDRVRAFRVGFQIHIPKPVEPAELVSVVANLTGRTG